MQIIMKSNLKKKIKIKKIYVYKTKFSATAPHDVEENQKNKKINSKTYQKV